MAVLTVFGSSDDLIELDGIEGADEFNDTSGTWTGVIEAPDGDTALLYVDYRNNGTWTVALGLWEEDYTLPAWPVEVVSGTEFNSYTTLAKITVPDGTTVRELER